MQNGAINPPAVVPRALTRIEPHSQLIAVRDVGSLVAAPRAIVHSMKVPIRHLTVVCVFAVHVSASFTSFAFLNERIYLDAAARANDGRVSWIRRTKMHDSVKDPKRSICRNVVSWPIF